MGHQHLSFELTLSLTVIILDLHKLLARDATGPGARPLNLALPICTYTKSVPTQINQGRFWGFCP